MEAIKTNRGAWAQPKILMYVEGDVRTWVLVVGVLKGGRNESRGYADTWGIEMWAGMVVHGVCGCREARRLEAKCAGGFKPGSAEKRWVDTHVGPKNDRVSRSQAFHFKYFILYC